MRMQGWLGLAVTGYLVGCGVAPEDMARESEAATAAEVQAQACVPGAAQEVKQVLPPDRVPVPPLVDEPRPRWMTNVAGTLYFVLDQDNGTALWKSDGTTAGTVELKAFPPPSTRERHLQNLTAVGDRLFFELYDPANGLTLWVSDGTPGGTRQVKDLSTCDDFSAQYGLQSLAGALSFLHQPCRAGHVELWRSDGTASGTVRVQDFGDGSGISGDARTASGRALFVQKDGVGPQLWHTDGSAGGTLLVRTFAPQARITRTLEVGGAVLFVIQDPATGTWLWRTDGTAAGTRALKRLDASASVVLTEQHVVDGMAVFALLDDGPSTELWKTDGTEAGTLRLDTFGTEARFLGITGPYATVLTRTEDGTHHELRRLSLAGGGKAFVATLDNPYAGYGLPVGIQNVVRMGSKVFFSQQIFSMGPAPAQVSLWVTDGTAGGTRVLSTRLSASDEYWSPLFDTGAGTLLFVGAADQTGLEPWVTDGTVAGTQAVGNAGSGPAGTLAREFLRVGDQVFFTAIRGAPGYALWKVPAAPICTANKPLPRQR